MPKNMTQQNELSGFTTVNVGARSNVGGAASSQEGAVMLLLLAFLVVLVFAGLGFAVHFLWIVAVILLVLWLVGFVIGRGEGAGKAGSNTRRT